MSTTTMTRTRLAPSKSVSAFPSMATSGAGPYSVSRFETIVEIPARVITAYHLGVGFTFFDIF